jgi:hypothetical protein
MTLYWIHFGSVAAGQDRRFSVFEVMETKAQLIISPAGRIETPGVVVELLVRRGADPDETCERVSAAIRNGISHVTVGKEQRVSLGH